MKTKMCALCKNIETVLFRIKINTSKNWLFACKTCCQKSQSLPHYKYGGTWKGSNIAP